MSSDKRDFKDFLCKEKFQYEINEDGEINYGPVYRSQKNNKYRFWMLTIKLFNKNTFIHLTDKLMSKLINDNSLKNYKAEIVRSYGLYEKDSKVTNTFPEIIRSGKNIGKANETNVLTQSIIQGRAEFLKKCKSGYKEDMEEDENILPYPMALQSYEKHKNKLTYPVLMQPKLDGIRTIVFKRNGVINIISRRHHEIIGFSKIKDRLDFLPENIFLDGELYSHKLSLQEISGIVRNENTINDKRLKFYVFDMFDINKPEMVLVERIKWLECNIKTDTYVNLLFYYLVNNEIESDEVYNNLLLQNYEGCVYKSLNYKYEFSFAREIRSMYYLKRKPFFDKEYKIIDYTKDKNGLIMFILETKDNIVFNSTPMMTKEVRIKLYNDIESKRVSFNKTYKNKMATIRYDDLSNNNVPLRARFVCVRDMTKD